MKHHEVTLGIGNCGCTMYPHVHHTCTCGWTYLMPSQMPVEADEVVVSRHLKETFEPGAVTCPSCNRRFGVLPALWVALGGRCTDCTERGSWVTRPRP